MTCLWRGNDQEACVYQCVVGAMKCVSKCLPLSLDLFRFICDTKVPIWIMRYNVEVTEDVLDTPNGMLALEWVLPTSNSQGPTPPKPSDFHRIVLYLHGGAYVLCNPGTHRPCTFPIADALNAALCVVEYRRPPEHSLCDTMEDIIATYRYLVHSFPDAEISLAGDSAGGGLAASALAMLKNDDPMPTRVVLVSPWTDLGDNGLRHTSSDGPSDYLSPHLMSWMAELALGDLSENELPASPLYAPGSFERFPPICVIWGQEEILSEQIEHFCNAWTQNGAKILRLCIQECAHVPLLFSFCHAASSNSLKDVSDFFNT